MSPNDFGAFFHASSSILLNSSQHRRNHKLDEWREVCHWIESLPYSEIITCNTIEKDKSNALTSAIAKLKAEFLLEQAKLYTGEKTVGAEELLAQEGEVSVSRESILQISF